MTIVSLKARSTRHAPNLNHTMQMEFLGKKRNKFLQLIVSVASFLAGKYVLQAFHKVYIHIL